MRSNPLEALARLPQKLWYLYRADTSGMTWNAMGIDPSQSHLQPLLSLFRMLAQLFYIVLIVFMFRGIWRLVQDGLIGNWPAMGLLIVLYFTAICLLFFGENRYHMPLMPWIMMYAASLCAISLHEKAAQTVPERMRLSESFNP